VGQGDEDSKRLPLPAGSLQQVAESEDGAVHLPPFWLHQPEMRLAFGRRSRYRAPDPLPQRDRLKPLYSDDHPPAPSFCQCLLAGLQNPIPVHLLCPHLERSASVATRTLHHWVERRSMRRAQPCERPVRTHRLPVRQGKAGLPDPSRPTSHLAVLPTLLGEESIPSEALVGASPVQPP
jgi:hypothetical protein